MNARNALLALWWMAGMGSAAAALRVVSDGQARAVIVLPAEPLAVERYAAEELRYHVQRATGVELPVQAADQPPAENQGAIRLGRAGGEDVSLPPNAFVIESTRSGLSIYGRDDEGGPLDPGVSAGTLHGVYELLETELGVRWLWPGSLGEVIPARTDWAVPVLRQTYEPRLLHGRVRTGLGQADTGWSSPAARDRYMQAQRVFLRRHFPVCLPPRTPPADRGGLAPAAHRI